jgi:hypothetical protein
MDAPVVAWQSKHIPVPGGVSGGMGRVRLRDRLPIPMASTDLVPCFYTGQNYRVEPPAQVLKRSEVRELKKQKIGKFIENGRLFLFFKALVKKAQRFFDGPLGVGNAMPFSRRTDPGQHFHYEIPRANDRGIRRWGFRSAASERNEKLLTRTLRVSARSRHSQQFIADAIRPHVPVALAGSI